MFKPTEELKQIITKQEQIVAKVASDLFGELVKATPVGNPLLWKTTPTNRKMYYNKEGKKLARPKNYVGGTLRDAWELKKIKDGFWVISNPMEYAEVRLSPYGANGKFGSKQFPAGIEPIVNKYDRILQSELRKI